MFMIIVLLPLFYKWKIYKNSILKRFQEVKDLYVGRNSSNWRKASVNA